MKGKQIVAIDVGSSNVVIAVGAVEDDGRVDILGIASEPVEGVNAGRLENSDTVGRAVQAAKTKIEESLGIKITEAYAGLSGDYVRCVQVTDHVYVQDTLGNGSNQITERDIKDLHLRMESVKLPDDREVIIAKEPLRYKIDDKEVEVPEGAYGRVLAATYNFVLCDRSMRERLRQCLLSQGIKVKEFVPNAWISHMAVATTEDKEEGVVIVDFGGGVTDVSVLVNGKVRHMASIPIGADSINTDIRSYGIPGNYVERIKVKYGSAVKDLTADDIIQFQSARKGAPKSILHRNLATIIEARLKEIAAWVQREIKEAGCGSRFAPVVLLTGGGAEMQYIENLFARELGLDDVRTVYPEYGFTESMTQHITTSAYATVASLLVYGAERGSCSVAVNQMGVRQETPFVPKRQDTKPHNTSVEKPAVEEKETPVDEKAKHGIPAIDPVASVEEGDSDDIIDVGDNKGGRNKLGLGRWIKNKFEKMSNSFSEEESEI